MNSESMNSYHNPYCSSNLLQSNQNNFYNLIKPCWKLERASRKNKIVNLDDSDDEEVEQNSTNHFQRNDYTSGRQPGFDNSSREHGIVVEETPEKAYSKPSMIQNDGLQTPSTQDSISNRNQESNLTSHSQVSIPPVNKRNASFRAHIASISRAVNKYIENDQLFLDSLENRVSNLNVKLIEVVNYLKMNIKGHKSKNVRTRNGKERKQAKIANIDDVKRLLHYSEIDDEITKDIKKGAFLAFKFFFDNFYEDWVQKKYEKTWKEKKNGAGIEAKVTFEKLKEEIASTFLNRDV